MQGSKLIRCILDQGVDKLLQKEQEREEQRGKVAILPAGRQGRSARGGWGLRACLLDHWAHSLLFPETLSKCLLFIVISIARNKMMLSRNKEIDDMKLNLLI